jgi:hypothetical protein
MSGDRWWLVPGDARAMRYPDRCAQCDAEATARVDVIPYCDACRAHASWSGPALLAGGAALIGGGAVLAMRAIAAFAPLHVHVGVTIAIALALMFAVARVRARVAHRAQAAEVTRAGVLARSRVWAERVAEANGVVARLAGASPLAHAERVFPYVACAAPIAFAIVLWPAWHFDLWIDNGTASAAIVRVDDRTIATIPAGEHARVELPRRRMEVATSGGAPLDLDPVDGRAWVFNVGRAHCYERRAYAYATSSDRFWMLPQPERIAEALFPIDARWIFEPAPDAISTDHASSLPEQHYALAIIACG